ncbi:MAG TPA: flagellar hook-associated protein FlgL [Acidobacteriaceae bacterium]|nr:flagellar hook-associated protein FlgL [Acidobacteriaceae bacterium]
MRIDPNFVQNLVSAVNQTAANQQTFTNEISTGVSVNSLSDNPSAASQDYLLRTEISANDSFVQSASTLGSQMQVTDTVLASVVTQLTSAISLATEGNNGTLNAQNVAAVTSQISGIRDEVVSLANSSYQGQYLFSGSQSQTQPFALGAGSPPPVLYNGDSVVTSTVTPNGQSIQTNLPGNAVFGSGSTGVLATLNNIINDFTTGVSAATVATDIANLSTGLQNVSQQRVILDNGMSRLQASSTYAQSETTQLQASQNAVIQSNPTLLATELSQTTTQHTSLIDMIANLDSQPTLFSLLH